MFYHERLQCYVRLKEVAKGLLNQCERWPRGNGYLTDQLKRAISSALLNLVEGNQRNSGKERERFFEISRGSLGEVAAILDLAEMLRFMNPQSHQSIKSELLEITRMIGGLRKSWS